MAYLNTDIGFYGGAYQGYNPYNYGGMNPYSYLPGMAGLGGTSQLGQAGINLPLSPTSFFQSFLPEVGSLTPGLRQSYRDFLGSEQAGTFAGVQDFIRSMQQHPDVQRAAYQSELAGLGTRLSPDELYQPEDAIGFDDWIKQELASKTSRLSNIYGSTGVGADVIAKDLRSFLAGNTSAVGSVFDFNIFGRQGATTPEAREAAFAQLVGDKMVRLDDGVFNPFSLDLMTDEYQWGAGKSGALQGTDLFRMTSGLLSTQNLDITGALANAMRQARETGADLGYKGKGMGNALADIAGGLTSRDWTIQQDPTLAAKIDQMFAGTPYKGSGGLYDFFVRRFA